MANVFSKGRAVMIFVFLLAGVWFLCGSAVPAQAETCVWEATDNNDISHPENWSGCTLSVEDDLVFDGAVTTTDGHLGGTGSMTAASITLEDDYISAILIENGAIVTTTGDFIQSGSSTFTMANTAKFYVGGDFTTNHGSFSGGAGTDVYLTGSGKIVGGNTSTTPSFDDLYIDGLYTLTTSTIINADLTISAGKSLDLATYDVAIGGNLANSGTITQTDGTVTMNDTGGHMSDNLGGSGNTTLYNLTIDQAINLVGNVTTTNILTIKTMKSLDAAGYTINLTGSGTPFVIDGTGTFTASTSTVNYAGSSATITTGTYYNLTVDTVGTLGGNITTNNNLTVNSSSSLDFSTFNAMITGNLTNSGTVTQTSGVVSTNGSNATLGGSGNTTFYILTIGDDTLLTLTGNVTTTNILNLNTALDAATYTINLTGSGEPFVIGIGNFIANNSTVNYSGASATIATATYYNLTVDTVGTLGGDVTSTNVLTINTGKSLDAATHNIVLSGTGTPLVISGTGAFTASTSTVTYSGATANIAAATYYNLTADGTDTLAGNVTSTNLLTINSSKSLDAATYTINLTAGSGAPLVIDGTFTASTSAVNYAGATSATITTGTYYNLTVDTVGTLGGDVTSTNINVNSGKSLDLATYNAVVGGNLANSGTITQTSGIVTMTGTGNLGGAGNITLAAVVFSGTVSLAGNVTTTATTTITGTLNGGENTLRLTANSGTPLFIDGGIFSSQTSTVVYAGTGSVVVADADSYYNLTLNTTSTLGGDIEVRNVLSTSANFDAATSTLTLSGGGTPWQTFGGMFNASTSTIVFTGSGTVNLPQLGSYYNLTLNNASGDFVLSGILPSISNNFTITAGTASASVDSQLSVGMGGPGGGAGGHFINNGTFTQTIGSVTIQGTGGTISGTGVYNFNSLYVATTTLSSDITVNGILTVNSNGTFDAATSTITLTSSSAPFVVDGAFSASTSTVVFSGTTANIPAATYYNLTVNGTDTLAGNVTSTNILTINTGKSLDAATYNIALSGLGTPLVISGTGVFTPSASTVTYSGATANIVATTYYNLTAAGTDTLAGNVTSTNLLTINSGNSLDAAAYTINLTKDSGTPFVIDGTFTASTSLVNYAGATDATIATGTYYNLTIDTAGTLGGNITTNSNLTVNSGKSLNLSTYNATITGNFANSGTVTQTSGAVTMNGTTATLGGTGDTTLYDLTISAGDTITLTGNVTTTDILSINSGFDAGAYTINLTGSSTPLVIGAGVGTFIPNASTVNYAGTSANIATATYYNLTVDTVGTLAGNVTTTNVLTINSSKSLDAATYDIVLSGSGTPLVISGTGAFTASTSTVTYSGSSATNITSASYYNLTVNTTSTLAGNVTTTNVLTINAGKSLNAAIYGLRLTGNGTPLVDNGTLWTSFVPSSSGVYYLGTGTVTVTPESYALLTLGAGTYNLGGDILCSSLVINSGGTLNGATYTFELTGTVFNNSGTFNAQTSTFIYASASATNVVGATYYNLNIHNGADTLAGNVTTTNNLTIRDDGSLNLSTYNAIVAGNLANSGTVTQSASGKVTMNGASATLGGTGNTTLYDLQISGTTTTLSGTVTTTRDVIVDSGKTLALSTKNLNVGRHLSNSGTVTQTSGTVTMSGTGNLGGTGSTQLAALTMSGTITLAGDVTASSTATISGTMDAATKTFTLTGSGTPLVISGTFTPSTSTVVFSGTTANIPAATFYNLTANGTDTLAGNVTSTHVLTINSSKTLNASTRTITLSGASTPFVNNGTFNANSSTVQYTSTGSVTTTADTYWNLTLGSGTYTLGGNTTSTNSFTNGGTATIGSSYYLYVPGTFDNNGSITEDGIIKHPLTSSKLTDSSGSEVTTYDTSADSAYTTVQDDDGNLDASAVNTITGSVVTASTYSDAETITLTETGADTGIFRSAAYPFSVASGANSGNSRFEVSGNGTLTLAFIDSKDTSDTGADTAAYTGSSYSSGSSGSGSGYPMNTTPPKKKTPPPLPPPPPAEEKISPETPVSNPNSKIIITNIPSSAFQPGTVLKFTYQYKNESAKKVSIKIVRQLLNSRGKAVKSATLNTTLKAGSTYKNNVSELLSKTLAAGKYTVKVAVYGAKNKLIDQNSFKIQVEKLRQKYFSLNTDMPEANAFAFDLKLYAKIKAGTLLPNTIKMAYSYINSTDKRQTIKMTRELVGPDGKVLETKPGKWIMKVGEKDSQTFVQTLKSTLTPGDYLIRLRAYDWTSKELLAENSFGFAVELK